MTSAANSSRWLIASNPPRKIRSRMSGPSSNRLRKALATLVLTNGLAAGLLSSATPSVTRSRISASHRFVMRSLKHLVKSTHRSTTT
ncbi:hypothetical protein FOTG_19212 [Fusarium oxysporum f. sp. vasinfectum 25433]|uniref:Uncharacterized protein n=1 Tax=Fusarium oxysporum f. sp. vasinfectum 25433 TaxID=1089449 RepID=X0KU45_FUSOX|nr:hypothetical protein FOTG_19212 [Fusarium oxysporum f. sp. vasinfectum 25433]